MRVLFVTAEAVPFAKTGGLADVAGALPRALSAAGHDVALLLPFYRQAREKCGGDVEQTGLELNIALGAETIKPRVLATTLPDSDVRVYLLDHPPFFDREQLYGTPEGDYPDNAARFIFFSKAAMALPKALDWQPTIYHCNDWQSALVPVYLRLAAATDAFYHNSRSLFTIHNLAYQGLFPAEAFALTGLDGSLFSPEGLEFYGKLNLLKGGILYARIINTVSPRYAKEIQTPEFGCGLEGVLASRADCLFGIINGIDYSVWNPATDPLIPANYSPEDLSGKAVCKAKLQERCGLPVRPDVPLLGMISRLDAQKGLDLLAEILDELAELDLQFVLLGTGKQEFHDLFTQIGQRHPEKLSMNIMFNNELAHQIEAGCDMYVMPSRYEPCGLNQLYSLKYGTVPIVRKTGGLADTIVNATPTALGKGTANGFSFESYSARALYNTIRRALRLFYDRRAWRRLMLTGMRQDWSWQKSAAEYVELYQKALS